MTRDEALKAAHAAYNVAYDAAHAAYAALDAEVARIKKEYPQ
jgi:hypothetical protein